MAGIVELVVRHEVVECLAVGSDALADRPRQRLIGVRVAIRMHALDEGQVEVIDGPGARMKQVNARHGRNAGTSFLHAKAAATVAIHARGRSAAELHVRAALGVHRLPGIGQQPSR